MSRIDASAMERYLAARDRVAERLQALEPLLGPGEREPLAQARGRLERGAFVLAVVGEFSSGKSFLINALLGTFASEESHGGTEIAGLLATDINPSTATVTELEYAAQAEAWAHYEDGHSERIPLDRLRAFVAVGGMAGAGAMHDATRDEQGAPTRVVVKVDSPFLKRGFVVADTPGLASVNPAHRRSTLGFLPNADAVLYLIDTQQPFSEGDASFLSIVRGHLDSIFIVQTKIDLWEEPGSDARPTWESAYDRIAQMAAVHAPGTYVYALSARRYAQGILQGDAAAIESSRFERFLHALDASLIKNTGRARLRRALAQAQAASQQTLAAIEHERAMLALDETSLRERRAALLPELERLDEGVARERAALRDCAQARLEALDVLAAALAEDLERALEQAFDTTDVARLRDRGRLHVLVDRTVARVARDFAEQLAASVSGDLDDAIARGAALLPLPFSLADTAADAFGARAGTSLWKGDPREAMAAAIVLEAIGGPAVGFVHAVATRFASDASGRYMKRELTADLRAHIFPQLRLTIREFVQALGTKLGRVYTHYEDALTSAAARRREGEIGSIERALALHACNADRSEAARQLEQRAQRVHQLVLEIEDAVQAFLAHEEEISPADAGSEAVRRAHVAQAFDRESYDRGLRPQRWRVAVLGALRRGKSSLINTFAGHRVLADEAAGALAYPVHVRYGQTEQAFALQPDALWREIEIESALDEATRNPVLITTPWTLPHELVLVHVPAFDTGDPIAEDVNLVAAGAASEVLCLFSRQLSERELSLYERIAQLGKPMLFAHTIADNETAAERRHVVELARRYLKERAIAASRIFTISTLDYARAERERRAPAGWNEVDALLSTLEAHAQEHMSRLARLERAAAKSPVPTPQPAPRARPAGLLARIFGK